jgi:hypothetical protein
VDSSSQALSYLLYSNGTASANLSKREQAEQELLEQEKEIFLTEAVYDIYGMGEIY